MILYGILFFVYLVLMIKFCFHLTENVMCLYCFVLCSQTNVMYFVYVLVLGFSYYLFFYFCEFNDLNDKCVFFEITL
jgi:hypothetical protein